MSTMTEPPLVIDQTLQAAVTQCWHRGWQPADVLRIVARRLEESHLRLLRAVMAAEVATYASSTIDPGWAAQLAEGRVRIWWDRNLTAVTACGREHRHGWPGIVRVATQLDLLLRRLPALEVLGPIPGTALPPTVPSPRTAEVDERVLARVRLLLAKAESTEFPAEAETFTAGAQSLMARHSIDQALLAATGEVPGDSPAGRRIGLDNPYESAKASLLSAVAAANGCRAVWSKEFGFMTIVGFETDLDIVELLFTSLLVQATAAMTREGSRADRYGRSRTRSFRHGFLVAYAERIRERLTTARQQQTEAAAAEASATSPAYAANLLPVLASRADEVAATTATLFPHLREHRSRARLDGEGWASGRAAADRARLGAGAALPG